MHRRLFNKSIVELEAMGADPQLADPQLDELFEELRNRTTPRAIAPRSKAAALLRARNSTGILERYAAVTPAPLLGEANAPAPNGHPWVLSRKLSSMAWSARARTFFARNKMEWMGDLASRSGHEVLSSPGMGRKTFNEIHAQLRLAGLDFGAELGGWSPAQAAANPAPLPVAAKVEPKDLSECLKVRVLEVAASPRNAAWALRRFGWAGFEPQTLEEVGTHEGVTRERVRQVVGKIEAGLRERFQAPGSLRAIIDLALREAPCAEADLRAAILRSGLDEGGIGSAGLAAAAEIFGLTWPLDSFETAAGDILVPRSAMSLPVKVLALARKTASTRGSVVLDKLTQFEVGGLSKEAQARLAMLLLGGDPSWRPLDEQATWWWRPEHARGRRNRLANVIRKVLAVAPEIQLHELRDAVRRPHRTGHFSPPIAILARICAELEGVTVDGGIVRRGANLDWSHHLSPTELHIERLLASEGPLVSSEAMLNRASAFGLSEASLAVAKTYSPLLWRPRSGYYALVGASLPPGLLESLPARQRKSGNACIYEGWMPDGRVALAYRLSAANLRSGIVAVPSGYRTTLHRRYRLCVDGEAAGEIAVTETGTAWNLSRAWRLLGAEEGDAMLLVFDLKVGTATVWVGGRELAGEIAAGRAEQVLTALEQPASDSDPSSAEDDLDD